MTYTAKLVLAYMNQGMTAKEMFETKGIGSSVHEVEFIMEQINIVQGK